MNGRSLRIYACNTPHACASTYSIGEKNTFMYNNKLKIEWKQKTTNRKYSMNILGLCKDETIYQFSTSKYHLFINNKFTHPNTLIHTSCHACIAFYDLFPFIDYYFIELHKMCICTITYSILCNPVPPPLKALSLPSSL